MRGSVVSLGCQHKIYLFNKAPKVLFIQQSPKRAEKTADHLTNLKTKSMAYDVEINDVNRQIERVKLMGNS
ncbi:hypothetical protein [Candidatus Symbiopectobacterium sp.]|uniref:hypothetical protein n=1 Tax=Candidatus Symbiopectobacterium sp. TaxID=2816440 RepID=UPI0025BD5D4E|nr:hypothetical protein [Candidatus Symbiopectobacterium sp.]